MTTSVTTQRPNTSISSLSRPPKESAPTGANPPGHLGFFVFGRLSGSGSVEFIKTGALGHAPNELPQNSGRPAPPPSPSLFRFLNCAPIKPEPCRQGGLGQPEPAPGSLQPRRQAIWHWTRIEAEQVDDPPEEPRRWAMPVTLEQPYVAAIDLEPLCKVSVCEPVVEPPLPKVLPQ